MKKNIGYTNLLRPIQRTIYRKINLSYIIIYNIQILLSNALFFLNGTSYHPKDLNVSERQEIALNQILHVVIYNILL